MPGQRMHDDGGIPGSVFAALTSQDERHMKTIDEVRVQLLGEIDEIRRMINGGATKEELNLKLNDIRAELTGVRMEVNDIRTLLRGLQDAIIKKQQEGYIRIIKVQSALLSPVIIAVIIYIVEQFLPHR